MKREKAKIVKGDLELPKALLKYLKWRYPFYRIPKLKEYSQKIIDYSREKGQLPFYANVDIDNDGENEIVVIQKSLINKIGRVLIISKQHDKFKVEKIKWRLPVNALFFDYLIEVAEPGEYQTFGLTGQEENKELNDSMKSKKIQVKYPHIITKGYLSRVIYWDGEKYVQEKI